MPDNDPGWIVGSEAYYNAWGFNGGEPNGTPWLGGGAVRAYNQSTDEIKNSWGLITIYAGIYGEG